MCIYMYSFCICICVDWSPAVMTIVPFWQTVIMANNTLSVHRQAGDNV